MNTNQHFDMSNLPSVVAEASIGAVSSADIVFSRLDGGDEVGILDGVVLAQD